MHHSFETLGSMYVATVHTQLNECFRTLMMRLHPRYGGYQPRAFYFEAVVFAEKLLLNGVAAFIRKPTPQITFGVLTAAAFLIVQVHVDPHAAHDEALLGKLLVVAVFLSLMVGAHVELMGDQEWTSDAVATQSIMVACTIASAAAGVLLIIKYALQKVFEKQAEQTRRWKEWNTRQKELGEVAELQRKEEKRRVKAAAEVEAQRATVRAGLQQALQTESDTSDSDEDASREADAQVAMEAIKWAVASLAGPEMAILPAVERTLKRELQRRLGRYIEFKSTVQQLWSEQVGRPYRGILADSQTGSAGDSVSPRGGFTLGGVRQVLHLAAAQKAVSVALEFTDAGTHIDEVPLSELVPTHIGPGPNVMSVMTVSTNACGVLGDCTCPVCLLNAGT